MSEKKPDSTPMRNIPPFGLRMQPDLKARIEEAAAENGRSLNAEIVQRLEASFDESSGFDTLANEAFVKGMLFTFTAALLDTQDPLAALREYRNRLAHDQYHKETRKLVVQLAKALQEIPSD